MARLTIPQAEVLRMCSGPLGFLADDMGASERRVAVRLATRGLLNMASGKRASITLEGLRALQSQGSQGVLVSGLELGKS